jgi:hypothetical protein
MFTPIIALSSNEGICQLFSDKNPTTFHEKKFPPAQRGELVDVLRRTMAPDITLEQFGNLAQNHGMEHHLYSVRWWQIVLDVDQRAKSLCNDLSGKPVLSRSTLHIVALKLDLACEPVARWYALSYSVEVDVAESLKIYFTSDDVERIVSIYGARGPRRLVLTAGLLITGSDAALRQHIAEQMTVVLSAKRENDKAPSEETAQVLDSETKKLESLRAYAVRTISLTPSPADNGEWDFHCDVRQVYDNDESAFANDTKCANEMGRIERLLLINRARRRKNITT